ncbi:tetratricopeptide repeat protein [bacterium]|jgi:tetratricopeptide (TPR) repeat protein|nr:tetratricopeptide repeat protein [bacterium]
MINGLEQQSHWRNVLILAQQAEVKGNFTEAEEHFKEALSLAKQLPDSPHSVLLSLNRLGELYRLKDDFKQAEDCYRQAYELAASSANEDKGLIKAQAAILAKMLVAQSRIDEALEFDLAEEVYLDAAGIALLAGKKELALQYLASGIKFLEQECPEQNKSQALHFLSYARLLQTAGQNEKAESVFRLALSCHEAAGQIDPFLITSIVDGLARVLNEQSRADEANELWEKYRQYNV